MRFRGRAYRSLLPLCAATALLICATSLSREADYYPGVARFTADYSVVFLPGTVSELVFDTTNCPACRDTLPEWRFIGPLKLDGLIRAGEYEPLESEAQRSDILVNCPELLECMHTHRAVNLRRRISMAVPYDTLVWSRSKNRWVVVDDITKHFSIKFSVERSVDSVISCLRSAPLLSNVGPMQRPIIDAPIDRRGDMNLNGINAEVADAQILKCFFLHGISAFEVILEGQVSASDVNNDGIPLTVADLVYIYRIITGDARPFPKLHPLRDTVNVEFHKETVSMQAPVPVAALWAQFVVRDSVDISNHTDMKIEHTLQDTMVKVLVYPGFENLGNSIPAGNSDVFSISGEAELIKMQASDYDGNLLNLIVQTPEGELRFAKPHW